MVVEEMVVRRGNDLDDAKRSLSRKAAEHPVASPNLPLLVDKGLPNATTLCNTLGIQLVPFVEAHGMRLFGLAVVLVIIFAPSQQEAAEDTLAEIDDIIAAIEREFLGVEPPTVMQPVGQNACSYERDDLFSVFDVQSASFSQIEGILQDIAGRSNDLGSELTLPCPRRFVESNETEIARLEEIDIPAHLAEVRLLNDCAGPAHDQTVERQEADMLPAQRDALQQRADQFLALESTSTNMMRQYGFFEQQRLELLRGLKGNLALCD